jgi:Cytochrome c3
MHVITRFGGFRTKRRAGETGIMSGRSILSFVAFALLITACQGAPAANQAPEPPTVLPTPIPPEATNTPSTTVEQVEVTWKTSPYLDRIHLENGLTCQSCHNPFPPTSAPDKSVCLSCHGKTYAGLAELTANVDPNPHASHLGQAPCTDCHGVHKPFVYYCSSCHPEMQYSGRFAVNTSTPPAN